MRKQIYIYFLLFTFQNLCSQALTMEQQNLISHFISLVKQKDKIKLAEFVTYPLSRQKPLPSINTKKEFIERFDEIFDDTLISIISNTDPKKDWSEVGWRGITFGSGLLWLDTEGKLIGINYESQAEKLKKEKLLKSIKKKLYKRIQNFKRPCSIIETDQFRIRIDELHDGSFRYSSWNIKKSMGEKPDLILTGGLIEFDGSGGNHNYIFKNEEYTYEVTITILGDGSEYDANLTIYKNEKEIFNQPAKQIE